MNFVVLFNRSTFNEIDLFQHLQSQALGKLDLMWASISLDTRYKRGDLTIYLVWFVSRNRGKTDILPTIQLSLIVAVKLYLLVLMLN